MINRILEEDFHRIYEVPDRGSSILVTGSHGFIGAYLIEFFVYMNRVVKFRYKIYGMDNFIAGEKNRLAHLEGEPNVFLYSRNISTFASWVDFPAADYVFHCASIAAPKFYRKHPLETIAVNVHGTEGILKWAQMGKPKAILHMSSSEIYGEPQEVPTPETCSGQVHPLHERAEYDESKRMSETLCKIYQQRFDVPVKIARPFNVYGPGQRLDDGRVIPQLMTALLSRTPFTIYGNGSSTRSYCYISDAVVQLFAVLLKGQPGEAYNVGNGDDETSLIRLAQVANRVFDGAPAIRFMEATEELKDAPTRRRPDVTKIRLLTHGPMIDLAEGLRRTYDSYKRA